MTNPTANRKPRPLFKWIGACTVIAAFCFAAATTQAETMAIEFSQDDQAGFDLWPVAIASNASSTTTSNFTTNPVATSGTTTVTVTASTLLAIAPNRGSSNGNPPGYTYQNLYEDLLIATSPTGFLTLDFSGLNPNTTYALTLFAWDPGSSEANDKVWTVTQG